MLSEVYLDLVACACACFGLVHGGALDAQFAEASLSKSGDESVGRLAAYFGYEGRDVVLIRCTSSNL
jgi:hypothetical protein